MISGVCKKRPKRKKRFDMNRRRNGNVEVASRIVVPIIKDIADMWIHYSIIVCCKINCSVHE